MSLNASESTSQNEMPVLKKKFPIFLSIYSGETSFKTSVENNNILKNQFDGFIGHQKIKKDFTWFDYFNWLVQNKVIKSIK